MAIDVKLTYFRYPIEEMLGYLDNTKYPYKATKPSLATIRNVARDLALLQETELDSLVNLELVAIFEENNMLKAEIKYSLLKQTTGSIIEKTIIAPITQLGVGPYEKHGYHKFD